MGFLNTKQTNNYFLVGGTWALLARYNRLLIHAALDLDLKACKDCQAMVVFHDISLHRPSTAHGRSTHLCVALLNAWCSNLFIFATLFVCSWHNACAPSILKLPLIFRVPHALAPRMTLKMNAPCSVPGHSSIQIHIYREKSNPMRNRTQDPYRSK